MTGIMKSPPTDSGGEDMNEQHGGVDVIAN